VTTGCFRAGLGMSSAVKGSRYSRVVLLVPLKVRSPMFFRMRESRSSDVRGLASCFRAFIRRCMTRWSARARKQIISCARMLSGRRCCTNFDIGLQHTEAPIDVGQDLWPHFPYCGREPDCSGPPARIRTCAPTHPAPASGADGKRATACRIRSASRDRLSRLRVRHLLRPPGFPWCQ